MREWCSLVKDNTSDMLKRQTTVIAMKQGNKKDCTRTVSKILNFLIVSMHNFKDISTRQETGVE